MNFGKTGYEWKEIAGKSTRPTLLRALNIRASGAGEKTVHQQETTTGRELRCFRELTCSNINSLPQVSP